jgi:hypothetical protein
MNRFKLKVFTGALVLAAFLAALGSGVTPPPASAAPTGPNCVLEPTGGTFDLALLDPAAVGLESRIAMQGAGFMVSDPRCPDGVTFAPLPAHSWSIVERPAGSTAALSATNTLTARLTPDRAGAWNVRFTSCPSGCIVSGGRHIAARTYDLSFTAVTVREGRVSSDELYAKLVVLFAGTRIQISHTGAGRAVAPGVMSYIDFGPVAEAAGAPDYLPLPIEPVERSVSDEVRALLLAAQPVGGALVGVDIDKIRILANNLFLDLSGNAYANWTASIGDGGLELSLSLQSDHPSIKCEGHYRVESIYVITWDDGWSDDLCPDFDLSQMDLSIKLIPMVVDGQLTLSNAQVTVALASQGVQSDLIDFFKDVTGQAETQIATTIRQKLLEDQTRQKLGKVLTEALRKQFPDLASVVRVQVVGSELVVEYLPTGPARNLPVAPIRGVPAAS